jgi:hypothetical protein
MAPRDLELDVIAPPFISQPRGTAVTFGLFDGRTSQVFVARPDSDEPVLALRSPAIVTAAVAVPESSRTYVIARDSGSHVDLGVLAHEPDDADGQWSTVVAPTSEWERVRDGDRDFLLVSDEERWIVQISCSGGLGCRLRWLDQSDGDTGEVLDLDYGIVLGMAGSRVVLTAMPPEVRAECFDRCPALVVDLESGSLEYAGELCADEGVVTDGANGPLLIYASAHSFCGDERYGVSAIDLDRNALHASAIPLGARLLPTVNGEPLRVATVPHSWVMTHEDRNLAWLVSEDGGQVEIDRPADWGT